MMWLARPSEHGKQAVVDESGFSFVCSGKLQSEVTSPVTGWSLRNETVFGNFNFICICYESSYSLRTKNIYQSFSSPIYQSISILIVFIIYLSPHFYIQRYEYFVSCLTHNNHKNRELCLQRKLWSQKFPETMTVSSLNMENNRAVLPGTFSLNEVCFFRSEMQ